MQTFNNIVLPVSCCICVKVSSERQPSSCGSRQDDLNKHLFRLHIYFIAYDSDCKIQSEIWQSEMKLDI